MCLAYGLTWFWSLSGADLLGFFLLIMFTGLYGVAPILARRSLVRELEPSYVAVELPELPANIIEVFQRAAAELAHLGFFATAHLTNSQARTNQTSAVSIWVNPATKDLVQVIAVFAPALPPGM